MSRWFLLPLLTVSFALAQSERGNITGVVTDSTGASVANALVTITSGATNISAHAVTRSTGEYNALNLGPGVYKIEIAAPGFRRFVADGVTLTAGASIRMDAELQVGLVTDSIEVRAQALAMKTEDAKITTTVENKLVDELPLVVGGSLRSTYDLVSTVPADGRRRERSLEQRRTSGGQAPKSGRVRSRPATPISPGFGTHR